MEFLAVCGKKAGNLWQGSDLFFPEPLECNFHAKDFAEEDDPGLSLDGRFFFGHHQGYQYYFFETGSERVWLYTEGDGLDREHVPASEESTLTRGRRPDGQAL